MLRVALTGGIGSGKTTAAAMLRDLGCFVSQSDEVARAMMQPGEAVYEAIVRQFGPGVVRADGSLDRRSLAKVAFAERRADELNAIVHPPVIAYQSQWMHSIGEQHPRAIAVVESALIFETKHGRSAEGQMPWRTRFDRIILVIASQQTRIQRYIARASASSTVERASAEADARARIHAQMPDAEKAALSDVVIANDGTLDELRQHMTEVWQHLRSEADLPKR